MNTPSKMIAPSDSTKDTVLIVDDSTMSLGVIVNYLEEFGITTLIASNGETALKRARYASPDIILLDVLMPGIDGFETCRQLKSEVETKEIPVIFMTALTDTENKIKGFSAGAADYVTKPVQQEELLARVTTHLENRKFREHLKEEVRKRTIDLEKRTLELEMANKQLYMQISERKQVEKALKQSERELTIRNKIANVFLTVPDQEMFGEVLQILLRETASKYGTFGYIDEKENLICPSMTRDIWDKCQIPDKDIIFPRETWGGIWGRALIEKKTMYSNESLSVPEGHIPILRVLDIPVINHGDVIGNILVANKAIDYNEKDIEFLASISDYIAPVLAARLQRDRQENDRKETEKEKTNLEKQLQQVQKMEAIGTLAGGIAHDFNNILTPVLLRTEMALLDISDEQKVQRNLEQVLKAGYRARELVQQILTFSRQSEQEVRPLNLSLLIKETAKLLRASIPTTIEIQQDIQSESGAVFADPIQIHQVLMNLCTNAAHAMRNKGGILEIGLIDVDIYADGKYPDLKPGPYLKLTVKDTGHGIEPSIIEKIFDPFFTTKERDEGTGMGLSVVHGITKSYGGKISAESEPGKGTIFNVFLPKVTKGSESVVEISNKLPEGTEQVLLVDDEEEVVSTMQQMLQDLGYKVEGYMDSVNALQSFKEAPDQFDLVITDQTMPVMTGEEFAKNLMDIRPDIPVILCTGFSETITKEKAKTIGIKEFVMKPIIMGKIAKVIRDVLDENQ